jgi:pimeloyl-ACP methyl ester carboxylesterase
VLLKFIKQRAARNRCNPWRAARLSLVFPIRMSPVKKRHVFYISGFDPRGVEAYYRLFAEECPKHATLSAAVISIGPRCKQSALSTTWHTIRETDDGRVDTTFEFLRWDDIVRRHWHGAYSELYLLGLKTYWLSIAPGNQGYLSRLKKLSGWNFLLGISPAIVLFLIPLLALFAALTGHQLGRLLPIPAPWPSLALAVLCAGGALAAAMWLERRASIGWLLRSFGFMREYCTKGVAEFDQRIDAFARHIATYVQSSDDDEIILVGHSSGANIAVSVLAKALKIEPQLLRNESQVCLLTLGATIPLQGLIPWADEFRRELAQLAAAGNLPWVDISSPHDIASFALHNPVTASGVTIDGKPAQSPQVVSAAFGEVLTPATLARLKYNVFRMHFQYLMAGERFRANNYFAITTDAQRFVDRFRKPG